MATLPMGKGGPGYNLHNHNSNDEDDDDVIFTEVLLFSRNCFKCFESTCLIPTVTL